jgi:Tetratricopeptide repeat/Peptidase_C39 like family
VPQWPRPARLAGAALAAALAGCASPAGLDLARLSPALPDRAEIAAVPFVPQDELYCGPAALATVLGWSGEPVTQAGLAPVVFTPGRAGSLQQDMLSAARRHDRLAVPLANLDALLTEIAAGHPVLVLQNLGLAIAPQWHYAVAVGYDRPAAKIVLRSGGEARRQVSFATFERTWARADHWALVVLPPDRLPATAGEAALLEAAAGLERSDRLDAAASAYETILQRWPDSLGARIGLANARYGSGDLGAAVAALQRATRDHPDSTAAWNNLAHVLAQSGETEAALAAARQAIELGGPLAVIARATEAEILTQAAAWKQPDTASAVALVERPAPR